jgi:hypothetical protein
VEELKDINLLYQEIAIIRNQNKPLPSKPLLLQLQEKADNLKNLVPEEFFLDESLHLVFVDTENNGHKGTIEYCRELSFYSDKLKEWLFYDMDFDDVFRMESFFNELMNAFPEPVVFVHYNYTENKLLKDFFKKFHDVAPLHSYCDLLPLARELIDTKNPDSERLYCITRNLGNIAKYWFEGADSQFNVPREYQIKATTGRKSELDVCFLYNYLFHAVKKYLL